MIGFYVFEFDRRNIPIDDSLPVFQFATVSIVFAVLYGHYISTPSNQKVGATDSASLGEDRIVISIVLVSAPLTLEARYGVFSAIGNTQPTFALVCLAAIAEQEGAADSYHRRRRRGADN